MNRTASQKQAVESSKMGIANAPLESFLNLLCRPPSYISRSIALRLANELWLSTTQRQQYLSRRCHRSYWRSSPPSHIVRHRYNHDSLALASRQIKHPALQKSPVRSLRQRDADKHQTREAASSSRGSVTTRSRRNRRTSREDPRNEAG